MYAAQQQAQASKEVTAQQTWANRPELNTPWGSQTWQTSSAIDPATGLPVTKWTGNVTLSPEEQAALDSQQRIQQGRSDTAETLLGQATGAFETPFDWGSLPQVPGSTTDASNAAFQRMQDFMAPTRERQQARLENQLVNQGLRRGSEAYRNAMSDLDDQFTREDQAFMTQAGQEGRSDIQTSQGLRQAAIDEQIKRRGMTLNELNALLSGQQVNMPNMPNVMPAGKAEGLQSLQANAQKDQGSDWGSAVGAGASAIGTVALVAL
jgi:hypothetical protein